MAFAGSNSSTSINHQLVLHTVKNIENHDVQTLNMAGFPFPMFSEDLERKSGYSNSLVELKNDIGNVDALVISVNEHNGSPSAFFKNMLDWLSRIDRKFLGDKNVFLMSASTGKRGGVGSLEIVKNMLPRFGAEIVATFSLPSFGENFQIEKGIVDEQLNTAHQQALQSFLESL